jgi:hypothetical protein
MIKASKILWAYQDEKNHPDSIIEWWCPEAFFKTVENNKKWSLNASFTDYIGDTKKPESLFKITLFDQDKNKRYEYLKILPNELIKKPSKNGKFGIKFANSYIEGAYPDYNILLEDPKNNIKLDLKFHALAKPYWVAQNVTNGWLPWGLGFYRYGFVPKCDLSGKLIIKNKTYSVEGIGYYEHVWGDFSFKNPLTLLSGLKRTISIYSKLAGWWLHHHDMKIPKSIKFSSENNPFGYDWAWAVLDNGWSIFYGNIMLWIMEGPAAGTLIVSKDDKTYKEFCNINFYYNKTKYVKEYDFYYPSDFSLTARNGKEELYLHFVMTSDCRKFINKFPGKKYWRAFLICEAPGSVEGYYFDGKKKIKLNGFSKIEPQRQISVIGHNSLKLDFLLPPEGLGVSFDLNSHFLNRRLKTKVQLRPNIKVDFSKEKYG